LTRRPLQFPESIQAALGRRYAKHKSHWLAGDGDWPLVITLGNPSEAEATGNVDFLRSWIDAWQNWRGAGTLKWRERHWRTLGAQRLPYRIELYSPEDVVQWLGQDRKWQKACNRYLRLSTRWPSLIDSLKHHFKVLSEYSDLDFNRLESFLDWLNLNPRSNLYVRQLPIAGFDSKWLENRKGVVKDFVAALQRINPSSVDFYQCCGLRCAPNLIRLRFLDPMLREKIGGFGDITAPVSELAALTLPIKCAFIIENHQTGLAFCDLPGAVVVMGLGYGVDMLSEIKWLKSVNAIYWGDIDTHGFAILNRARSRLHSLRSVLMDEGTLLRHQPLWVEEKQQNSADVLTNLTNDEQSVYRSLKEQRWGLNIRLEQERISWAEAWDAVLNVYNSWSNSIVSGMQAES